MKIVITEEKLKEAIEYAIAERGLVDNILRNNIETYIKAGSITADSQEKPYPALKKLLLDFMTDPEDTASLRFGVDEEYIDFYLKNRNSSNS
jgi:hypothetical protein